MSYSIEIHATKAIKNLKFFFAKLTNNNGFLEFHFSQNQILHKKQYFFGKANVLQDALI